jgi:hypothetical protein
LIEKPAREYSAIALVRLTAGMVASFDDMRDRMLRESAAVGGDAVIIDQVGEKSVGGLISGGAYVPLSNRQLSGTVIVFVEGGSQ